MTHKNMNNRKFFCDLDGVGADFASGRDALGIPSAEFKLMPGAYRNLLPYPGFAKNLQTLLDWGWDVWIATKIPHDNPGAATEKLLWVNEHLPFLRKSVIITPNKGTLGGPMDFLLDDRPHKAHCEDFVGTFLRYGPENEYKNWEQVMLKMAKYRPDSDICRDVIVDGDIIPIRINSSERRVVQVADLPLHIKDGMLEYYGRALLINEEEYVYDKYLRHYLTSKGYEL